MTNASADPPAALAGSIFWQRDPGHWHFIRPIQIEIDRNIRLVNLDLRLPQSPSWSPVSGGQAYTRPLIK